MSTAIGGSCVDATSDFVRAVARWQSLSSSEERLVGAIDTHQARFPLLAALRAVPLPFLEGCPEPATALSWIEDGGTR
jgi:hypothetical protein